MFIFVIPSGLIHWLLQSVWIDRRGQTKMVFS